MSLKLPVRNKFAANRPIDEEFEKRQAERCDANVAATIELEAKESGVAVVPKVESHAIATRADSVQQLLSAATLKASTLKLTKAEREALRADFPDSDFQRGAGGDTNLIYLEHCALRNRLSDVIGLGEWSFEIIRSWNEDFKAGNPPKDATRVYVEGMLLIRGCKVGLAIGDGNYFKSNAKGNYGDAYESAKTAAFRRCAKDFGIGLQAFSKDWCEEFKKKYPGFERPERKK